MPGVIKLNLKTITRIWKENKHFILFMALIFVFRSAVADWNPVPTGSMKPTILEGDRILVNKLAYDIRVPFTHISIKKLSDPKRGDIIIFDSVRSDKRLVKRVVGVPGDVVALVDNNLIINYEPLSYSVEQINPLSVDKVENLLGVRHSIRVSNGYKKPSANFTPVYIPQNHYLVLGDNRDNSADSRVIGLVPRHEIVGRTSTVIMSLNYDNYYIPRSDRFFHRL